MRERGALAKASGQSSVHHSCRMSTIGMTSKCQNVQNSSGTTIRRRVVSLQSFEHKSIDYEELFSICNGLQLENSGQLFQVKLLRYRKMSKNR